MTDNGKVFTGRFNHPVVEVLFDAICREHGIEHLLTQPRSPTTTGKIERFHRSMRAEFLSDREPFATLKTAQQALDEWVQDYNTARPHQSLQMATPAQRFHAGAPASPPSTAKSPAPIAAAPTGSHAVTANITVPEPGAEGVIITQGGLVGGWTLYAHGRKLKYCYNFLGIEHYMITADEPIPVGKHQVRMEFAYDGGGLAKGGDVTLYYDGKPVGHGRVEQTQPLLYSCDEACDVGADSGSPASPDYAPPATSSPVRSTGCRSTSAATARTT